MIVILLSTLATTLRHLQMVQKLQCPHLMSFGGDGTGAITDPFGHKLSITTHIKDMTPEEITKAVQEFMRSICK